MSLMKGTRGYTAVLALLALVFGLLNWYTLPAPIARSKTLGTYVYGVQYVSIPSARLSAFWKRPISLSAAVLVPRDSGERPEKYPVAYHIPGFGAEMRAEAVRLAREVRVIEQAHPELKMVHVVLDPNTSFDGSFEYHGFVDSDCGGPWASALLGEVVPQIETTFPVKRGGQSRYLVGHSSGAWTAVWQFVRYPSMFNGVWASSPDPLDFRDFFGADLTGSENVYWKSSGEGRPYMRGSDLTVPAVLRPEENEDGEESVNEALSEYLSDEWKWSRCDEHGEPYPLFDRQSGVVDDEVAKDWARFDVRKYVESHWDELRDHIAGGLHIVCGEDDSFFLDAPTRLFCSALEERGVGNACQMVPHRAHMNIFRPHRTYPEGLLERFLEEMHKREQRSAVGVG